MTHNLGRTFATLAASTAVIGHIEAWAGCGACHWPVRHAWLDPLGLTMAAIAAGLYSALALAWPTLSWAKRFTMATGLLATHGALLALKSSHGTACPICLAITAIAVGLWIVAAIATPAQPACGKPHVAIAIVAAAATIGIIGWLTLAITFFPRPG